MRRFFFLLLAITCLLPLPFFYKHLSHGFRLQKLYRPPAGPSEMQKTEELAALLNQPFTYLGKGMQFFVFVSQDEQIVLKLVRKNARRIEKTLQACRLAFASAREETGLIYIHLQATFGDEPTIRIKNRLHIPLSLPLDEYAFVVQRKTEPFKQTLLAALKEGKGEPLIDSYLNLIHSRCQKGICNTDILLAKNFGFSCGQAFEIDFGNYMQLSDPKAEFRCFAHRMRRFLQKHAPDQLPLYEEKVAIR